jgi:hypothetical protein
MQLQYASEVEKLVCNIKSVSQEMVKNLCPNYNGCQLTKIEGFIPDQKQKYLYLKSYCEAGEIYWNKCNRYQTKIALNFCPDFVLPDSNFTIEEILDKFEE